VLFQNDVMQALHPLQKKAEKVYSSLPEIRSLATENVSSVLILQLDDEPELQFLV